MTKTEKVIYCVATIWLALGMFSTGVVQLLKIKDEVDMIKKLGYPEYFLTLLGVWKILGVVVILLPKMPLIKEWAYAGFFFSMSGAIISHIASANCWVDILPALLLLFLTLTSWFFRPTSRRLVEIKK